MSGWLRELFSVNIFADSERGGDTSICTAWCADSERGGDTSICTAWCADSERVALL